jgi:hypothetical protein
MFQTPNRLGMIAIGKMITRSTGTGMLQTNRAMKKAVRGMSRSGVGTAIPAM